MLGDRGWSEGTSGVADSALIGAANDIAPGIVEQARALAVAGEDWISALSRAATTVLMTDAQRRLLNIQLERARAGLPPLDSSQYGLGVSVGIGADTQRMLLIGGAVLLGMFLLMRRR